MARRSWPCGAEQARAKSCQIQQVVNGGGASFHNKLKRKWIMNDLCGGMFADVGGDILRQGAMPTLVDDDSDCLHSSCGEKRVF